MAWVGEEGKLLQVVKLRELLAQFPDEYWLSAQSIANTGNLGVYAGPYGPIVAAIDFGSEDVERYDDTHEEEPPSTST